MAPLRLLCVNSSAEERADLVRDVTLGAGHTVTELAPRAIADFMLSGKPIASATVVDKLPAYAFGYDLLVVLGSPLGVLSAPNEEDQAPFSFVQQTERLILSFHAAGKPVLGLCLGAQLVSRAFGGLVTRLPKDEAHTALPAAFASAPTPCGMEFGYHPVEWTPAAENDLLVGPALRAARAMGGQPEFVQWHSDTFSVPPGAVALCSRPTCENQGFRIGARTYAFQCHIECGISNAKLWYKEYISGEDSFAPKETWEPVSEAVDIAAIHAHCDRALARGGIARGETFTRKLIQKLLEDATSARTERVLRRTTVAVGMLALLIALQRRR